MEKTLVSTATWFGRSRKELDELAAALSRSGFSEHNALHIGPGYSSTDNCSYEPVELAAALERAKKPWKLTVMDYNPDVCRRITTQEKLPIDHVMASTFPDYVTRFLDSMGRAGNTVPNEVIIPHRFRERMTVAEGDLTKPQTFPSGIYNVLVGLNVFYYLPPAEKTRAVDALASKMPTGGVLLSDLTIDGFTVIRPILSSERADKRIGNAYISVKT